MKKVLIGLMCMLLLVAGCGKNTDKDKKKDDSAKATDAKVTVAKDDGLDVSSIVSSDNKIIFTIKNTSKEIIDNILLNVAFFDEKEVLMATSNAYTRNLENGKESIVVVDFPREYVKYQTIIPNTVQVKVNKEVYGTKTATLYTSKVSATTEKVKNDNTILNVEVKNASGVVLSDVELATVFYKNGKVVGAVTSYLTQVGTTGKTTVSIPFKVTGETGKTVDYDEVKTVVNSASKTKAAK